MSDLLPSSTELAQMESLLNAFHEPGTSNVKKYEIEILLKNMAEKPGFWKRSLTYICETTNQYVHIYCLSHIERLISKKWFALRKEHCAEVRHTLYHLVVGNHQVLPKFFRNKLIKLIVLIARVDWPHLYPDFFTNIFQLIQKSDTTVLGLMFLQIASEELVCPCDDLSVSRREELKRYFLHHIPDVYRILADLLDRYIQCQRGAVTVTPPPSPTHGQPCVTLPEDSVTFFNSMLENTCMTSSWDHVKKDMVCAALQALSHIFSWVPLEVDKAPHLINQLFKLASIIPKREEDGEDCVSTMALGVLTEITYKVFMSAACKLIMLSVSKQFLLVLEQLVNMHDMNYVGRSYSEKVNEFLVQFMKSHLHRVEDNPEFCLERFMTTVFNYSFRQNSLDSYLQILEMWKSFVSTIHNREQHLTRYNILILTIARQVLQTCLFKVHAEMMSSLDDSVPDEDGLTLLEKLMRNSMDLLIEVTHVMPGEIYSIMSEKWREHYQVYLRLHEGVRIVENRRMLILSEQESWDLHLLLRDLSTFTCIIGNMDQHFHGQGTKDQHGFQDENLQVKLQEAEGMVGKLKAMAAYAMEQRFHVVHVSSPKLNEDFLQVHMHVLEALVPWSGWIAFLASRNCLEPLYLSYVEEILYATVPILSNLEEPPKLHLSAARLLVHFTREVRPIGLWNRPPFRNLYVEQSTIHQLQVEAQRLVYEAIYCALLLPWHPSSQNIDQDWETRGNVLLGLVWRLTADFRNEQLTPHLVPFEVISEVIPRTMSQLCGLVECVKNESNMSKRIVNKSLQEPLKKAVALLGPFLHTYPILETLLDFILAVFGALQQQLGVEAVGNIISSVFGVVTREHVKSIVREENHEGASKTIEKILLMLQLVVSEPGSAFNTLVDSITSFCLYEVYPEVAEKTSPGIKLSLFTVFHSVLLNRWQHFYPCSLKKFGEVDNVRHVDELLGILRAYGQTLLERDINIFKHNLASLEELNMKRNLYRKKVFIEELWCNFLTALLQCLINKTHVLLNEEIEVAIFTLASVDFIAFHDFLKKFLSLVRTVTNDQALSLLKNYGIEKDAPSFIRNIQRLIIDLRCYQTQNDSLQDSCLMI